MTTEQSIFKPWVPEWGIRIAIFSLFLPNLVLFGISTANANSACSFYGFEPNDVQFSLIALYTGLVGFFPLEKRFASFFVTKDYLFMSVLFEIVTAYACYNARDLYMLILFRFLQGIANSCLASVCSSLIFSRLYTERSRAIGYSIVFGILLSVTPFITLISAPFLDFLDYDRLYFLMMYTFIPGSLFFLVIMRRGHLNPRIPISSIDWQSFVIYSLALLLIAYVLIYGQQYNWFSDKRMRWAFFVFLIATGLYVLRQMRLKTPYINLNVFSSPKFVTGFFLILVFYITRGAFNLTTTYFSSVLGMDPIHTGDILVFNILGVLIGAIVSSRLLISYRPFRMIWITGFSALLIYFLWMIFLFDSMAESSAFVIPLVLQGFGSGMLLASIIISMVTAVPPLLGPSAIAAAISFRLLSTCISLTLVNYFQLYYQQDHFNRFQEHLSGPDPILVQRFSMYREILATKGLGTERSILLSGRLLKAAIDQQAQVLAVIDYYYLVSGILFITILLIAFIPVLRRYKALIYPLRDFPI
jgi:MFS transporter, DHA2 family, multidrug resistance protein